MTTTTKPGRAAARDVAMERALVKAQRKIAAAAGDVLSQRNGAIAHLWARGYTQQQITDLLNRANAAEGQEPYSVDAVQKVLRRVRDAAS